MAKASPPFPISGTVGNFTFFNRNGQTYVRQKIKRLRKRSKKWLAKHERQTENRITFGGASKAACKIHKMLALKSRGMLRPYSHNYIANKLKQAPERTFRHVDHYSFRAAHSALQGLDLSNDNSQSQHIKLTPIGPHHRPTHLQVNGLDQAAKAIEIHGNAHLELRIQLKFIEFVEMKYEGVDKWDSVKPDQYYHPSPKTDWIPAEILPSEGLTLPLDPNPYHLKPDTNLLVFILIEFREIRPVGKRIVLHLDQSIARLAAMQYSEAMAQEIAQLKLEPSRIKPEEPPTLEIARQNPEAFLKSALNRLLNHPAAPPPA